MRPAEAECGDQATRANENGRYDHGTSEPRVELLSRIEDVIGQPQPVAARQR